tara:strand:+ start:6237 stop:7346 length:1110 start_codon:yes stop_codon:yes gene_type:complete
MKQLLFFSLFIVFILSPTLSFSQVYKADEMRFYSWDGAPDWALDATVENTFDNGGNKETKAETFDAPSTQASYQYIKTYNTSNNIISEVRQNWAAGWQNLSQTIYGYDGGTIKLTSEITKSWDAGSMTFTTNDTQILYEYSGDDVTLYTVQKWNAGWVDSQISEFVYDSPGVISYAIYSTIISGTTYQEKETYFYDNDMVDYIEYYDPDGSGGWELNGQNIVDYYGDGKIKTQTQQIYDNPGWTNEFLDTYTYDANGNLEEIISSSWEDDDWVEGGKVEWDYSVAAPFVLSTKSFEKESFKVFPNPASDIIHIASNGTIEKVELFDSVGKKVLFTSNNEKINVEHLKSGMYLLKVFNNNRSATKRIIIE